MIESGVSPVSATSPATPPPPALLRQPLLEPAPLLLSPTVLGASGDASALAFPGLLGTALPGPVLPAAADGLAAPAPADRVRREQEFHNQIYADGGREHLTRWYDAVRSAEAEQDRLVRLHARGRSVLEYGCADGALSIDALGLPAIAAELHGIDISDYAIAAANARARAGGFEAKARFHAMNAEATTLADGAYDLVFGRSIIHHLDLDAAFREIARMLKPGGVAIFLEPMGHNPLINWYRRRTPALRTADEHPLLESDLAIARRYFTRVDAASYGLTSLLAAPFDSPKLMRAFERVDRLLFRWPLLRRQAWFTLMLARKA